MISPRRPAVLVLTLTLAAACSGSPHRGQVKGLVTAAPAPKPVATLSSELAQLPASSVYVVTARKDVSYATLAGELAAVAKLPGVLGASIEKGRLQVTVRPGLETSRRFALLRQLAAVGVVSVPTRTR